MLTGDGQAKSDRIGAAGPLTSSEIAALRQAIQNVWTRPGGTYEDEKVPLKIRINPDGEVINATVDDPDDRMSRDPAYRAFAESAVRAVLRASPLPIPNGKHEQVNNSVFRFSPTMNCR